MITRGSSCWISRQYVLYYGRCSRSIGCRGSVVKGQPSTLCKWRGDAYNSVAVCKDIGIGSRTYSISSRQCFNISINNNSHIINRHCTACYCMSGARCIIAIATTFLQLGHGWQFGFLSHHTWMHVLVCGEQLQTTFFASPC